VLGCTHTGKGQLGEHEQVEVIGGCLAQHGVGTVEVVVDITDLGGELETGDSHDALLDSARATYDSHDGARGWWGMELGLRTTSGVVWSGGPEGQRGRRAKAD
jgi:hypothetical protein